MQIITLLTKRSVREPNKEKKFLKFYSSGNFTAGNMIEIISGNKKTPAIILKSESANTYKEEIRSGNILIKKLIFSKTGENANGKIYDNFEISEIKKFLKSPNEAKKSENKNISNFFPRKNIKKIIKKEKRKGGISTIEDLMVKKVLNREKIYNNPMQELVDNVRTYFYENSRYGFGSFSYCIGMFKQLPLRDVEQIFAEVKQLKKRNFEKKKIFWYRIGKEIKK